MSEKRPLTEQARNEFQSLAALPISDMQSKEKVRRLMAQRKRDSIHNRFIDSRKNRKNGQLSEWGFERLACHSADQPLIAPDVMPAMICRWKKMYMINGGIVMMMTSAKSKFHCVLN